MTPDEIRQRCYEDLNFFAHFVSPHRVYGDVHREVFRWWQTSLGKESDHTLLLLPRDHQKSHCAAVKAAWLITRDPSTTILYVSATAGLAIKQLRAIKGVLLSENYRRLWPNMIHEQESKRSKWTETEINVDHPIREKEGVRDSTVFAAGVGANLTGLHAQHVFLDDLVVPTNAYTEEGRTKVRELYSQLASIETTGATETVVGTRYHPSDIYKDLMEMKEPEFNEEGEIIKEVSVYDVMLRKVEEDGMFLWPREVRPDGKAFGFNLKELARKKAKYLDKVQFWAQSYQETNAPDSYRITSEKFQYYDRAKLKQEGGRWFIGTRPLNVYASIDFAYSLSKKSDYTAIVVVGMDPDGYIYVLDIDRFKTDKISVYFERILALHARWDFNRLRAETVAAQSMIVDDLKDKIREEGLRLSISEHKPHRSEGSKAERIAAVLEPRYDNQSIFHFKGGYTPVLEEEVMFARPSHDDIKDAFAAVVEICRPPRHIRTKKKDNNVIYNTRFGGVA